MPKPVPALFFVSGACQTLAAWFLPSCILPLYSFLFYFCSIPFQCLHFVIKLNCAYLINIRKHTRHLVASAKHSTWPGPKISNSTFVLVVLINNLFVTFPVLCENLYAFHRLQFLQSLWHMDPQIQEAEGGFDRGQTIKLWGRRLKLYFRFQIDRTHKLTWKQVTASFSP